MDEDLKRTIKIRVNEKVGTDGRGRTVWTKPIAPVELELMSTQMMEQIIHSDDEERKEQLLALAEGEDGIIACDTTSNRFEVLKDDDLEAALQAAKNPKTDTGLTQYTLTVEETAEPTQELSLVTTQHLRVMLDPSGAGEQDDLVIEEDVGGYNPYDKG